jgi:hypothetical protein
MSYLQQRLNTVNTEPVASGMDGGVKVHPTYQAQMNNVVKYRHSFENFASYFSDVMNEVAGQAYFICKNRCVDDVKRLSGVNVLENKALLKQCENKCKAEFIASAYQITQVNNVLI